MDRAEILAALTLARETYLVRAATGLPCDGTRDYIDQLLDELSYCDLVSA